MAGNGKRSAGGKKGKNPTEKVAEYRHKGAKRKNIPPAGLEAQGVLREAPKIRYEYNPHLPPILRTATKAAEVDKLPDLLATSRQRALSTNEASLIAEALRRQEPWLEWSGKREKPWFEVDPVALHMHERVSTQAILRVLAREDVERELFADPQQEYAQAVQFYQHDVDWANRMILGDSLQVMASLARREDLSGRVQMIYVDPPYGINFKSNFQPSLSQRDVKDREQDLTREPEMVKAYRDTWTLGIHSYLTYLRDRLAMSRELLSDSGSIFVQISDDNLHRVRCVMDEVFGPSNFMAIINYQTMTPLESGYIESVFDYVIWFAKDKTKIKYRNVLQPKQFEGNPEFKFVELAGFYEELSDEELETLATSERRDAVFKRSVLESSGFTQSCMFPFEFEGKTYSPRGGKSWRTNPEGMKRLEAASRLFVRGTKLYFKLFFRDFGYTSLLNSWPDTVAGFSDAKLYIVQTHPKVIQRCMLMTTDPGDLVLDPTCGSGTTAFVAEQWGRRWITCDSSRVALALARQRLMTARFFYYQLRELSAEDLQNNKEGTWLAELDSNNKPTGRRLTFKCKTVPHITLRSVAQNNSLDPIFAKHDPIIAERLKDMNAALKNVTPEIRQILSGKLIEKQKLKGKKSITEADRRRWELPKKGWNAWEVPFDTDPDWPKPLQDALDAYRDAWRVKMAEVNACIGANAATEELVDKPEPVKGVVRVAGPFTMEGVISVEDGLDTPIGGAPDELETFDGDAAVVNAEAHLDKIIRLLKASGVDFPGNKNMKFGRLDALTGASLIHAEGEWRNGDKQERRVAVSVGPEVGNVTSMQVEDVIRDANRKGYDDVVFAAFGFDAAAQDAIESASHPKLRLHMALIRPDVAMGDLLKTQPGSQLFTVFSAPRVKGPTKQPGGEFIVEVEGMDVYDPVSNTLFPTDKERIAAWFLDTDYDGRTFCICQAFFPDKSKWERLAKALGDADVIEEDAFDALSGLTSLPFPRPERLGKGEKWRIAVKVLDPRGNEGLRVLTLN
jgi:adenine-specific DNA-methyltransferase